MGHQSLTRMMIQFLVTISTFLILLTPTTESVKTTGTNTKAASPYTNCGCQCSNLTFKDKYGKTNGNCKSVDHTGAQWCYVDPNQSSSCQDLSYTSTRFPGKPWSYEACSTPACGNNGGYNNGGYNNGGSSNGGYTNGGYNNGASSNGGYNNRYNSGSNNGYNSGSSSCRGTKCLSGAGSNEYNSGSYGSGSSSGSHGSGSSSGSYGSGSNSGSYGSG